MSEATPPALGTADVQAILDRSPFISWLGLKVDRVDHVAGEIVMLMPLRAELERRAGTRQFHGGPIAAFIDVVGDFAIGMLVGGGVPTIDLRIDYLRPATGGMLKATGRVRRRGRSIAIVDVEVSDEEGRLVAMGRAAYVPQVG